MTTYISITQIIIAVLIITLVLLQQRGTGLGAAFGGGGDGGVYSTRRGMQQKFYWATIVLGVAFVGMAMFQLFI